MKEVSIIVPVYNTKKEYLTKCLDSLVNQTISDSIEIIIIDDGSTNIDSINICDEYAKKYSNVITIHQKNQGLGQTRNNGMKQAKGNWIMFVDSDDWVENNICEELLKEDDGKTDIIMSSCNECFKNEINKAIMFNENKIIWKTEEEKENIQIPLITTYILKDKNYNPKYIMIAWDKLYKKEFIIKNKLYEASKIKFKEDNIFNLYCFELAKKIVYKNCNLYNYRQCKNSLIHNNDFKFIDLNLEYLDAEAEFIKKFNKDDIFIDAHYVRTVQSIVNIIEKYMINGNEKYKKQKEKIKQVINAKNTKEAINNVKLKYLSSYLKLIVFLAKNKRYWLLIQMVKLANYIKRPQKQVNKEMYD